MRRLFLDRLRMNHRGRFFCLARVDQQAAAGEAIWYGVEMPVDEIARQLF